MNIKINKSKMAKTGFSALALSCILGSAYANNEAKILTVKTAQKISYIKPYGEFNVNILQHLQKQKNNGGLSVKDIDVNQKDEKDEKLKTIYGGGAKVGVEVGIPMKSQEATICIESATDEKNSFNLTKYYAKLGSFTIGKTNSTFCENNSLLKGSKLLTKFSNTFNENFHYALAIETNTSVFNEKKQEDDESNIKKFIKGKEIPTFSTSFKYKRENWHLQIGGLFRPLQYKNTTEDKNKILYAFGTQLNGKINMIPKILTMSAHGLWGKGIGSYIAELGKDYDIIDKELLPAIGGALSIKYYLIPEKLSSTINGNIIYLEEGEEKKRKENDYKMGIKLSGNLTWHITKQINIGVTYQHGIKYIIEKEKNGDANTLAAQATFSF